MITEHTTGLDQMNSMPNAITAGGDGNLWFTDEGTPGQIGKATTTGTITESTTNLQSGTVPDAITTSTDGNVWFEDNLGGAQAIGRIALPSGTVQEFKNGLAKSLQDDITTGADGNIWVEQSMPGGIARITPAGVITEFTNGLLPGAGGDGDTLTTGPDGNLWFNDRGAKAIGKVSLQIAPTASTGAAGAITNSGATVSGSVNSLGTATAVTFQYGTAPSLGSSASAGTLPAGGDAANVTAALSGLPAGTVIYYRVVADNGFGTANGDEKTFTTTGTKPAPPPPPATETATAKIGNQQLTLTTPSLQTCTTNANKLSATLNSAVIRGSRGAKLRFRSAAFFIDKGVKHTRKQTRHLRHGRKQTVTVVIFTANTSVQRVPATVALRLAGLKSGTHTLKVIVAYKQTVSRHQRHKTVTATRTVTKMLTARFRIC